MFQLLKAHNTPKGIKLSNSYITGYTSTVHGSTIQPAYDKTEGSVKLCHVHYFCQPMLIFYLTEGVYGVLV